MSLCMYRCRDGKEMEFTSLFGELVRDTRRARMFVRKLKCAAERRRSHRQRTASSTVRARWSGGEAFFVTRVESAVHEKRGKD